MNPRQTTKCLIKPHKKLFENWHSKQHDILQIYIYKMKRKIHGFVSFFHSFCHPYKQVQKKYNAESEPTYLLRFPLGNVVSVMPE